MDSHFSSHTRELIASSRYVALELGYEYISTMHFFLADCSLKSEYSIWKFVFNSDEEFRQFYESCRAGDPINIQASHDGSVPLTLEAEYAITKGIKEKYHYKQVQPFHIFLAAAKVKNSIFRSILTPQEGLHERLLRFCIQQGYLPEGTKRKGFLGIFK